MANKKVKGYTKNIPSIMIPGGSPVEPPEQVTVISIEQQPDHQVNEYIDVDVNDVIDKALKYKPQQHRDELVPFLIFCIERGVKTVLEIGSYDGGLTYIFSELFESVVAIDLVHRATYEKENIWKITGNTQIPETLYGKLPFDHPYDLIFIDGDHSEQGVTNDFNFFKQSLSPTGIMAFHDIKNDIDNVIPGKSHKDYKCFVSEFWKKTKKEWDYEEIYSFKDTWMADRIHDMSNFGGIGILKQLKTTTK